MLDLIKYTASLLALVFISLGLDAQCNTDQHSNHLSDSWQSCSTTTLPDGSGENAHWILYDLGTDYYITNLHYWNYNVSGATDNGFNQVEIRASSDYSTWTNIGTYSFDEAEASNQYIGKNLSLEGFAARYVLLLARSNYGGACYGISELRFDLDTQPATSGLEGEYNGNLGLSLYPNPNNGHFKVNLSEVEGTHLNVTDVFGRVIESQKIEEAGTITVLLKERPAGTYFVQLVNGTSVRTEKILIH